MSSDCSDSTELPDKDAAGGWSSRGRTQWMGSHLTSRRKTLFSLAYLAITPLLLAATALGQSSEDGCFWQTWHPAALPSRSGQDATSTPSQPLLCAPGAFVTSFYADVEEDTTNWAVGPTSAQCSDGTFLGFYNLFENVTELDPPALVLLEPAGIATMRGSAGESLLSVGLVAEASSEWQDACPAGMLITGYQVVEIVNVSSGCHTEQIRFACSQPDPSSRCGSASAPSTEFAPDTAAAAAPWAHAQAAAPKPTLRELIHKNSAPAPAPSSMQYMLLVVQFTVENGTADQVPTERVEHVLRDLEGPELNTISFVRRNGCTASTVQASDANTFVGCFQAGPLPGDLALYFIDDLSRQFESGRFVDILKNHNITGTGAKVLFAGITSRLPKATSPAPSPLPALAALGINASRGNAMAGIIGGIIAAAALALAILLISVFCLLRRRKAAAAAAAAKGSPKKPFITPFAVPSLGNSSRDMREDSSILFMPQPVHLRATPAPPIFSWMVPDAVQSAPSPPALHSAPVPASLPMQHSSEGVLTWTSPFQNAISSKNGAQREVPGPGNARHLTQDSDEVMDSMQGGSVWKVMRAEAQEYETGTSGRTSMSLDKIRDMQAWMAMFPDGTDSWQIQMEDLEICRDSRGRGIQLGGGASGKVYKAILNEVEEVAVKCLEGSSAAQQALFLREIEIHRRCRSSHVVQFLGACVQPRCVMLVTELMEQSLHSLIHDECKPFSWEEQGKAAALDVAQALAYLHKQRVVHLDVKSSNVLLTKDGHAKVADVGLSQVLQNTYLTQLDGAGTFAYASPELLSGGSNCSTKADIWSFGVLMHEMVTRELPRRGKLSDIKSPEQCPAYTASLIWQCINRDPNERPTAKAIVKILQTATTIAEARQILEEEGEVSSQSSSLGRRRSNFSEMGIQRSTSTPHLRAQLERHSIM